MPIKSIYGQPFQKKCFENTIDLFLKQHTMVHSSKVSNIKNTTFEDELWHNLDEKTFREFVKTDHGTIARNMWHTTRIEDLTMNILVAGDMQILKTDNWIKKLNCIVEDPGNAMTDDEVIEFSKHINMNALRNYRMAVDVRTRKIISSLSLPDLKRKMEKLRLQKILDEGGVLDVEGANWLIDFWGKKTVAGILLMPATRHNLVHINQAKRIMSIR